MLLLATWFYINASVQPNYPKIQTLQIIALPIIWPFLWVVYTDVLSTAVIMGMAAFVQARHYKWAAFAGLLSLLIRQTNIVWIILFWLMSLHQENLVAQIHSIYQQIVRFKAFRHSFDITSIKKTIPFVVPIAAFILFAVINRGIAIGDAGAHQVGKLYPTQVYFLLIVLWITLLPLHIINLRKIQILILRFRWIFLSLFFILLAVYLYTFEVTHQYNVGPSRYFLRNWLLNLIKDYWLLKLAMFPLIIWTALSISVMTLKSKSQYWLYPFAVASVLIIPLIEQRYYIIPFVLLMIFRVPMRQSLEGILLGWLVLLSFFLTRSIYSGRHFL
jgi:alpha-1,2-glucosyltransferase